MISICKLDNDFKQETKDMKTIHDWKNGYAIDCPLPGETCELSDCGYNINCNFVYNPGKHKKCLKCDGRYICIFNGG